MTCSVYFQEENLVKFIQEEEKRKSVSQKLENTLGEISNQVQENNNKTNKLRDENLDITKKFRELLIQYDQKEQVTDRTIFEFLFS